MAPECVDIRVRLYPIGMYRLQCTACRKSGPERNGKSELRVDTVALCGRWRCGTARQDGRVQHAVAHRISRFLRREKERVGAASAHALLHAPHRGEAKQTKGDQRQHERLCGVDVEELSRVLLGLGLGLGGAQVDGGSLTRTRVSHRDGFVDRESLGKWISAADFALLM